MKQYVITDLNNSVHEYEEGRNPKDALMFLLFCATKESECPNIIKTTPELAQYLVTHKDSGRKTYFKVEEK